MPSTATQADPKPHPELMPGLMRLASRLSGDSDAEDLVQSTYVRALEHGGPVRAPSSWLRQVLRNERRMDVRQRQRRSDREFAVATPKTTPVDVEDVVHCLEVARVVNELVEELAPDLRLVVRERYFEGDTAAEIARRHAIPAGTVRWRLKSGLDHLRGRLDERYGGKRCLWAGGFIPTLSSAAASKGPTVGGASAATAKGMNTMMIKILVGAALTASVGGAVWVGTTGSDDATQPAAVAAKPSVARAAKTKAVDTAPDSPASVDSGKNIAASKAAWEARVAKIQAARAAAPKRESKPQAAAQQWVVAQGAHNQADLAAEDPHAGGAMMEVASQVGVMVKGCSDFMTDLPSNLSLKANIIGAPDVGTVVQSVELISAGDAPEDLQECLTESMYTLDLGDSDTTFERSVQLMIGSAGADMADMAMQDANLDEETRARIREAMERHGAGEGDEPGSHRPHVLHFGEHQPKRDKPE